MPGVGSALSSLGYGAMLAFSSLLATERGWSPVWLTFTAFAFALVVARLFFGHVPDLGLGGAKVALVCVLIEAAGLGPALACIRPCAGGAGRGAHGIWLFAGLSRPWRGSGSTRSAAKPRTCDGRLHRVPRCGARFWHPGARPDRGLVWYLGAVFLETAIVVACGAVIAARLLWVSPVNAKKK